MSECNNCSNCKCLKEFRIQGIFNSDDLDSAKEYCEGKEGIVFVGYDGEKGEIIFNGTQEEKEKVLKLFN